MRSRRRVVTRRRLLPRRVRHHPATRVLLVIALALLGMHVVQRTAASALEAQRKWGEQRTVVVAQRHIDIGDTIDGDAVALESWPMAMIPDGAFDAMPNGRVAIAAIERGEAMVSARVAPEGLTGIAALTPRGARAVAIPVGPAVVPLRVGDRVDLIAGFDALSTSEGQSPAITVARDALVVAVDDNRITVAVRESEAARTAFAIIAGTVVPALRST